MNIKEQLKIQSIQALKDGDTTTRSITLVVLGDIEVNECRSKDGTITEDACLKIISKLVKSNQEMIRAYQDRIHDFNTAFSTKVTCTELIKELEAEIPILQKYLPKTLTMAEITVEFADLVDTIGSVPFGQAVGLCMKTAKMKGLVVDSKDVQAFVKVSQA